MPLATVLGVLGVFRSFGFRSLRVLVVERFRVRGFSVFKGLGFSWFGDV